MMATTRPYSSGSKTATFVGTGPTGATIGGGPVKRAIQEPAKELVSAQVLQQAVFS
jgi:hypothetical protein